LVSTKDIFMITLKNANTKVSIVGDIRTVVNIYLRVYLANERLTDKQLEVATELVLNYTEYVNNAVIEPYASTILFSTEVRKNICSHLKISPPHLNNTFNALTKKNILAREGSRYLMNPALVPTNSLTFNFSLNGK